MKPKPGDVVRVGGRASVQFGGDRALVFRVIKVCDKPTYHGWIWLTGYVLDRAGKALDRREIYVQHDGLRLIGAAATTDAQRLTKPTAKRSGRGRAGRQERRSER